MRICGLPVSAVPALLWVCLCLVGGASGQLAGDRLATDYSVEEVSELDEIAFEQRALVEARRYCTYNAPARRTLCDRTSAGTAVLDVGSPDGRFALIFSDGYPRLLYGATRIVRWSSAIRLANTGCAYYATVYTAGGAMQLRCSTTVWLSLVVRNYGKVANRYVITNTGVVSFYNAGTLLMRIVPGVAKTSPSTAWIVSSRKTTTSRTRTKTRTRTRTKTKTTSTRSKTKTTSSRTLTRTSTSRTSTSRTATTKTTTYTTINPSLVPRFPIQNEVGAYFAAWSIYGRNYNLRNFSTTASASNLTYLNYAFGEVVPDGAGAYKCQLQDAWADYQTPFTATTSVDGVADTTGNLFGNFNQLKKLKVKFPNIRVLISLGGWTGSAYFSNASATQLLRSKLATSCIDLFLRGNLPVSGSLGGTGAAAGVFDGIDIDWVRRYHRSRVRIRAN